MPILCVFNKLPVIFFGETSSIYIVYLFITRKLLPWTEYKIRLAVYTDTVTSGDGPFSDWKPVRTTESGQYS
jgi:hypothetical protein